MEQNQIIGETRAMAANRAHTLPSSRWAGTGGIISCINGEDCQRQVILMKALFYRAFCLESGKGAKTYPGVDILLKKVV